MANVSNPKGLVPYSPQGVAPVAHICYIPSTDNTAVYLGDAVVLAGSADASGIYPTVAKVAVGTNYASGVVVGMAPMPELNDDFARALPYRAASTNRYVLVVGIDNPQQQYVIQGDEDLEAADVGNTANFATFPSPAGNTTTGWSYSQLDSSNIGTGTQLVIDGILPAPNNELGTACKAVVRINLHQSRNTTGV